MAELYGIDRYIITKHQKKCVQIESGYSDFLHDQGQQYNGRGYKMFCYSDLKGKFTIRDKRICFLDTIKLEIRSIDEELIIRLEEAVNKRGVCFGDVVEMLTRVQREDKKIEVGALKIKMISPITAYQTVPDTKWTRYYNPLEEEFEGLIQRNFQRKYTAYTGREPGGTISLKAVSVGEQDRCVTEFKQNKIRAWYGTYMLRGRPEYLNFLYQTGLGAKNGQGFGMFEEQR